MNDPKRQEIKNRIAAAQARNQSREHATSQTTNGQEWASQNSANQNSAGRNSSNQAPTYAGDYSEDGITGFIKDHPITTIAGALAVGVLVAGMFPSARKAARKGGARASALSAVGAQAVLGALHQGLEAGEEAARTGGDKLEDLGDVISDTTRSLKREALYAASRSGDTARVTARDTGKSLSRTFRDLLK